MTTIAVPAGLLRDRRVSSALALYELYLEDPAVAYDRAAQQLCCSEKHIRFLEDRLVRTGWLRIRRERGATGTSIERIFVTPTEVEIAS